MAAHTPSGTVTFLLTDLEGSTRMWHQDPVAMKAAIVRHDELLEKTVAAYRGHVFARMGDGMAAAFATVRDAVSAAAAFQQALAGEQWGAARPLRARVGATLGAERRWELRAEGAAMSMDEAVSYAPANIDPKLQTGPIASIDR